MRRGPVQAALEFDRARRLQEFDRVARTTAPERNRRPNGGRPMPLDHRVQWKRLVQFSHKILRRAGSAARARASTVIAHRGSEPASVPHEHPSEPDRGYPTPPRKVLPVPGTPRPSPWRLVLGGLHRAPRQLACAPYVSVPSFRVRLRCQQRVFQAWLAESGRNSCTLWDVSF